jgi:membrane-associated protease RseP (regulator of RpoE activity)
MVFDISDEREEKVREIVDGIMEISDIGSEQFRITVIGDFQVDMQQAIRAIRERALRHNLIPRFQRRNNKVLVQFIQRPPKPKPSNYAINIILFLATILTTMFAGALQAGVNPFLKIYVGWPFSLSIMVILGAHELGHYFASKRLGVDATPPYFIPVGHPIIGTFGAVIRMKSPIPDRKALLEIGVAGPLAGLFFAIPALVIGLRLSSMVPVSEGGWQLGNSILFAIISRLVVGQVPEGMDILLHPVAFAGWLGFFITALNLLPVGQLDGGHIVYGLMGRYQKWIGWIFFVLLFVFGIFWIGWFVWAMLILWFVKIQHPAPLDDLSGISLRHTIIGCITMVFFVLTFIPNPFPFTNLR